MECEGLTRLIVPGTDADVREAYSTLAARAQKALFGFEEEVAFVDIETTGVNPDRDHIIEVAAVIARGPEVLDRYSSLVDPGRPIPAEITKLTGIDDQMVSGAPSVESVVSKLAEFVEGRDIVAHNVTFDRGFLVRVTGEARFRGAWLDSVQLAQMALPRLRSHRLRDLADAFGVCTPSHRAADDAEALAGLWRVMLVALADLGPATLQRLTNLAPGAAWSLRPVIAHIAAGQGGTVALDLKDPRRARTSAGQAEALVDADDIECSCPPVEQVVTEFAEDGLAGRMYEGFEPREEQSRMAAAVLEAFGSETHAAIEAGTGVGKSIAYLVPAALFAMQNGVGVGVATKTNALMDQLVYSELPSLCSALDADLTYVALKGYDHYPCLRKFDRMSAELDEDSAERVIALVASLMTWVTQSSWGDLDSTNVYWSRELKSQVAASVADCTYRRCRYYPHLCYLHGVRRKASSAHIVVTNHALLFRDLVSAGGILPPIRHWIVDEAHSAESEARRQLTVGASHAELQAVVSLLHQAGRGGALGALRRGLGGTLIDDLASILADIERMEQESRTASTLVDSLFDFVKDLEQLTESSPYDSCDLRLTDESRETGIWGSVDGVGRSLAKRLTTIVEVGRRLMTRLEAESGAELTSEKADLAGILSRVAEQLDGLVTVLDGQDPSYVYSAYLDRRRNVTTEKLTAARLDVGEALSEEFFPRLKSVIFTSATIATGEDFSHFARVVGLSRLDASDWRAHRLSSSYDFERQMSVFVPSDIPEPRSGDYLASLEVLLEQVHLAMGGSVLTLFTNRRDMEALYRVLEPRMREAGIKLLVQGRGVSPKRLRDEFLADRHLSLFATKSFWEGFDAKGDTLRCVVVPRLPFGRPSDPLAQERGDREGRAAWRRYALPEAVIELKQAAGRLIRSSTDTGCLVVADVRVISQSYGREFLGSLPVDDIEVAETKEIAARIGRRFGDRPIDSD